MNSKRSRKEIIANRLGLMTARAKERHNFLQKEKLCQDCYIRIRGEDYRAVSLNDKTPLCGFSNRGAARLPTILVHFKTKLLPLSENVWKQKKERRIQCLIIRQALSKNGDMNSILNLNSKYDELIFALDEVSLGDKHNQPTYRCDILAVGIKHGKAVPVLIELKSDRSQGRLIDQLDFFSNEILKFKNEFGKLLKECVGREVMISDQIGKMLIWPLNKQAKKDTLPKYHEREIDVVEYEWNYNHPESIKFHFHPYTTK